MFFGFFSGSHAHAYKGMPPSRGQMRESTPAES